MGAEGGAVGILDPAVGSKGRSLTGQSLLDGLFGSDVPGVEQVEVLQVLGHQGRVGKARGFVFGGVLGNRQGRRHGFANGLGAAGRRTGRTLALAQVEGDAKALVAVELDGFHFPLAHRSRQPLLQGHRHFTGAGPLALGLGDDLLDLLLQGRQSLWADALCCTHAVLHSNSAFD